MKLTDVELASVLLLAAVVAYSAGSVAAHEGGADVRLTGDWRAAFTVEQAFPRGDGMGRTAARVHIEATAAEPSRSTAEGVPDALRGDLRPLGLRGQGLRGAVVRPVRGDSLEVTLGSGARTVVLTGRLECGRMTGRWRHASRGETAAGRFEMRREGGG